MDDLISRQAAIDIVVFECGKWIGLAKEISKQLKQLPSAQPDEEIIYCGECKHMMPNGRCNEFADDSLRPSASDFCSAAERKDNE